MCSACLVEKTDFDFEETKPQQADAPGADEAPLPYRISEMSNTNDMRLNRVGCFDVGVRCGEWGHIAMEVKVEDRQ
jgi:hypothetical protein